ncbi:hypothetical protein ACHAXA_001270, partial [Cyclostephanos tholiformis]
PTLPYLLIRVFYGKIYLSREDMKKKEKSHSINTVHMRYYVIVSSLFNDLPISPALSPIAMFNSKNENRPPGRASSVRTLRMLRVVGLLVLLSALGMEFLQDESPLTDVGVIDGRADNVSTFIHSGEGRVAEVLSRRAVSESSDVADYEELSHEQRNGELTGIVATKIDVDEQSKGDAISNSTENYEDGKIAKKNQRASSKVNNSNKTIDFDDCDGCIRRQVTPNVSSVIHGVYVQNPEPSEEPVLISVGTMQPSESTNPVEQIILLAERHSGADLIADHLAECFDIKVSDSYKRYQHWFQEEDLTKVPENSAVVAAIFRDPYDWVEAMRIEPHHAHDHLRWYRPRTNSKKSWKTMARPLEWKEFVTQPWIGKRGPTDEVLSRTNRGMNNAICMDSYSFYDAAPCSEKDSLTVEGLGEYKYEYQQDRSERGFSSIINLRREKILNHLSVADFHGTRAFISLRFEDMDVNGVLDLVKRLEEATGLKARCNATLSMAPHPTLEELPDDFIKWMSRFVDWEVESRIGYFRRGGVDAPQKNMIEAENHNATPKMLIESSMSTKPVEQIILLGERHSGTNWITDHLTECFDIKVTNQYKRFKHWFQEEDLTKVPENSAVIVAMFRDPYNWVEAMRVEPHHAHDHLRWYRDRTNLTQSWKTMARRIGWKEFVTQPWIGSRGSTDENISKTQGMTDSVECMDSYSFYDAAPCSEKDSQFIDGLGEYKYEYQHDGSERGYSSIIDLRREKILNHLSVANFRGSRAFFPFRFEDLNENGTGALIKNVEDVTGLKAKCNATMGKAPRRRLMEKRLTKHGELSKDFITWMNRFVDWEVESRIGYSKRG